MSRLGKFIWENTSGCNVMNELNHLATVFSKIMKPTLQLKLSQQLKLTPQLQQSIRLLQLSTLELNQEIERIVQENPLLELREDWNPPVTEYSFMNPESSDSTDLESMPSETAVSEVKTAPEENYEHDAEWFQENLFSYSAYQDDDYEAPQIPARPLSLREYLHLQASCLNQISEYERKIIGLLVDSLDDDGYLLHPLDELMEMLPAELGISLNDLQSALEYLQHFDPPGVGARNLQECLVLQLQALPDNVAHRDQALRVAQEYLKIFFLIVPIKTMIMKPRKFPPGH